MIISMKTLLQAAALSKVIGPIEITPDPVPVLDGDIYYDEQTEQEEYIESLHREASAYLRD